MPSKHYKYSLKTRHYSNNAIIQILVHKYLIANYLLMQYYKASE